MMIDITRPIFEMRLVYTTFVLRSIHEKRLVCDRVVAVCTKQSLKLVQHCINVIQIFSVCCEVHLSECEVPCRKKTIETTMSQT